MAEHLPPNIVTLELPASHRYLNLVGACISALLEREDRLPDRDRIIQQVELAVHETCINIVEHAYLNCPGRIMMHLRITKPPRKLVVDLYDTGKPFDISQFKQVETGSPKVRGYGLIIIHQLVERVTYMVESNRNHWCLEKDL